MSDISGVVIDSVSKKPIPNITVQLWRNSTSKYANVQDITDVDGNFSIVSDLLTDPDVFVSFIDPSNNWGNVVGTPAIFNDQTVEMEKGTLVQSVPWWVWIGIIVLVIGIIYFRKHLK